MTDLEQQRLLAAHYFPVKWARSMRLAGEGKRKLQKRLRDAAVEQQAVSLLPAHARCSSCEHYLVAPAGLAGTYCAARSDFHGYVSTASTDVCRHWRHA